MTTRIVTFLVGDSYKPSFATVTGRGPHPTYRYYMILYIFIHILISYVFFENGYHVHIFRFYEREKCSRCLFVYAFKRLQYPMSSQVSRCKQEPVPVHITSKNYTCTVGGHFCTSSYLMTQTSIALGLFHT